MMRSQMLRVFGNLHAQFTHSHSVFKREQTLLRNKHMLINWEDPYLRKEILLREIAHNTAMSCHINSIIFSFIHKSDSSSLKSVEIQVKISLQRIFSYLRLYNSLNLHLGNQLGDSQTARKEQFFPLAKFQVLALR